MERVTHNKLRGGGTPSKHPILFNKLKKKEGTKIVNIAMHDDFQLVDDYGVVSRFKVNNGGDYCLSLQLCVKHCAENCSNVNFMQFGVCKDEEIAESLSFESVMVDCETQTDYLICKTLTTVVKLDEGVDYCIWLNLNSDNNANYYYVKGMSHCQIVRV